MEDIYRRYDGDVYYKVIIYLLIFMCLLQHLFITIILLRIERIIFTAVGGSEMIKNSAYDDELIIERNEHTSTHHHYTSTASFLPIRSNAIFYWQWPFKFGY